MRGDGAPARFVDFHVINQGPSNVALFHDFHGILFLSNGRPFVGYDNKRG
jgi:hypothetical protein